MIFVQFNDAERNVHFPNDRRMALAIKRSVRFILIALALAIIGGAWLQYLILGLPPDPGMQPSVSSDIQPYGFPIWLRLTHWINFFFLALIIRSGLSILADHPRLYWNNGCYPNSEWARFTPLRVPANGMYTAKDDARYISPIIGLPGYRHTIGTARSWHFLNVPFFLVNGAVFVAFLFTTNHWMRIVPSSWDIVTNAWSVFVHYVTFNMPSEPNGYYQYNALQQLSYFAVVFVLAPLAMLTGLAMSPAIESRFHWLPRLFGNRQGARSIHFLVMLSYLLFLVVHVAMVCVTGFARNMNHITIGSDNAADQTGTLYGALIIVIVILFGVLAHWISWKKPRYLQRLEATMNGNLWKMTINKLIPRAHYTREDVSPYFWPNGKIPVSDEWQRLAENNFKDFRIKVDGLVENAVELSIEDLMQLETEQTITMHHCIQGWSGVAQWRGVTLKALIELVKPKKEATTVAFYSFGEGLYGGTYYDTHTLDNCLKPQSILAWEMNYQPLPPTYGAPLRLRIENQLGYKMVKWVCRIEFIESYKNIGKGFGGKNEDDEYFDQLASS